MPGIGDTFLEVETGQPISDQPRIDERAGIEPHLGHTLKRPIRRPMPLARPERRAHPEAIEPEDQSGHLRFDRIAISL